MGYGKKVTEITVRQFIDEISDQHYPMAGSIVAVSAAQAAALGEACMQISLDHQVDRLEWQDVTARIEEMAHIKSTLVEWSDQDATAIAQFMTIHAAGSDLSGNELIETQRILCDSPAEVGQLSVKAAAMLQDFRPLVFDQVQDDLEIAISLLAGAAQAAMLVLDSNLRLWPNEALAADYEPLRAELENKVNLLSPVSRVRN